MPFFWKVIDLVASGYLTLTVLQLPSLLKLVPIFSLYACLYDSIIDLEPSLSWIQYTVGLKGQGSQTGLF